MDFNKMIIGVFTGDKKQYELFCNYVKVIVDNKKVSIGSLGVDMNDFVINDIVSDLVLKILSNDRSIVDVARGHPITKSYFVQWVYYNIVDVVRKNLIKVNNKYEDNKENSEDTESNKRAKYQSKEIFFSAINAKLNASSEDKELDIEELYIKSITSQDNLDVEDLEISNYICTKILEFISNLPEKQQLVFCAYLGYVEKPTDISQSNYNQIFKRTKDKLISYIEEHVSKEDIIGIKDNIRKGALKDCDFYTFCRSIKKPDCG